MHNEHSRAMRNFNLQLSKIIDAIRDISAGHDKKTIPSGTITIAHYKFRIYG